MKVVISDAYSPTNIGDGELVRLSIDSVRSRFSVAPTVLCTDKAGFEADPTFSGSKFVFKPLSRVLWRTLGRPAKASLLVRDALAIVVGVLLSLIPIATTTRRRVVGAVGGLLRVPWLAEIAAANVVVGVGGGYLGDKYLRESLMTLSLFRVATSIGAEVETMPVSISSANRPLLRLTLKNFGRSVHWRSREMTTNNILVSLGLQSECVPDLAWLNAAKSYNSDERHTLVLAPLGSDFYASEDNAQPKAWPYIEELVSKMEPGNKVQLVAMHYWDERLQDGRDDQECQRLGKLIVERNPGLMVEVLRLRSYDQVLETMATAKLAVCERLHAALAGLAAGTPTKVIGYEPKHRGVLEMADLHILADESVHYVRNHISTEFISARGVRQAGQTHESVMRP